MGVDDQGEAIRLVSQDPEVETKEYHFTHAFWTHDRDHAMWADQPRVYNCIGRPMLDRLFEGTFPFNSFFPLIVHRLQRLLVRLRSDWFW